LCTEAALNAVQRRYPQIYTSNEKLLVDPKSINVIAKDFMIAMDSTVTLVLSLLTLEIVPSSERSSTSGASPLPNAIKPLLETTLEEIKVVLSGLIPEKKKRNILEEAMYEDDGPGGFEGEVMMQGIFIITLKLMVSL
jgi:ATPase family AAA domain-containing protein 2